MRHPEKWRETANPHELPFHHFSLTEVLGYPHAGNDVFQVKGMYQGREVEAYIKIARQRGADVENEIRTINALKWPLSPEIIDFDDEKKWIVTMARKGERLSTIVGENENGASLNYMHEYGRALADLHSVRGEFPKVKDRRFFHIPDREYFRENGLINVYEYLTAKRPAHVHECFCHGDFHYANILWENGHISAVLDYELSGIGNRDFDIAWALIHRPGQKFMNTTEEMRRFLEGYQSAGECGIETVVYYMILIYSYFYRVGRSDLKYQTYIEQFFRENMNG